MICEECREIMPLNHMGEWAGKYICGYCFTSRFPRETQRR